ncbi:twin-arginine translocase TatA/TatE family subunit [Pantoea ananatis]
MEGISIAKLLIIGALIVLLFGTNKLRSLGGDLEPAIKGFKKGHERRRHQCSAHHGRRNPAERVSHKD